MLLKSIKLTNFRQYKSAFIEFSTDAVKNITLITGEMGSGKTTLEQAFRFVLYGYSEFDNDILANTTALEKCNIGENVTAEVKLDFKFKKRNYSLTRSRTYHKQTFDKIVSVGDSKISVLETDTNGNSKPMNQFDAVSLIMQLIPYDLADYFFIDGEKIEKMTKNIKDDKKQEDFIKVVKSMLGLNYLFDSIKHITKANNEYKKQLLKLGGDDANSIQDKIEEIEDSLINIKSEISDLEDQKEKYREESEELNKIIQQFAEAQSQQLRYHKLIDSINKAKKDEYSVKQDVFRTDRSFAFYIAAPLMLKAKKMLIVENIQEVGIPNLHGSTLEYLLHEKRCLCGRELNEGSVEFNSLKNQMSHVPPHSISKSVNEFQKYISSNVDYYSITKDLIANAILKSVNFDENLRKMIDERDEISTKLDKIEKAAEAKTRYDFVMKQFHGIYRTIGMKTQETTQLEATKKKLEDEFQRLTYNIVASNKYKRYSVYAEELNRRLTLHLNEKESIIRKQLESQMNENLALAYKDGFQVKIDNNYHIKVNAVHSFYGSTLDKSTGQWLTIIFSFIASVMKMTRDISQNQNPDNIEEYPLILDAPFSTIDSKFVEKISEVLRTTSRQLVLFINIKDSDVFLQSSSMYVGKKYGLKSNSLVETFIEEVR